MATAAARLGRARSCAGARSIGVGAVFVACAFAVACGDPLAIRRGNYVPPSEATLPSAGGVFAPAHTTALAGVTGAWLSDVDLCGGCHADVFAQQQASAHAWSSFNNPVYRYSVESMREEVGNDASRMCAGCHDIALLVDGAMNAAVTSDDPRAHAGVTCRVCHGMSSATVDGNGSFTLSTEKIALPKSDDPASIEAHKLSAAPLRGPAMCGSCHRGFLSRETGNSHFLPGMDELTGHVQSAYTGSGLARLDGVEQKDCIGCHMAKEPAILGDAAAKDGMISSHRFAGGHTWLAAMLGDDTQLAAQRQMLADIITVDIAAARSDAWAYPAETVVPAAGRPLDFDVVIRNTGVGHRFPGGVLDAQDVFVVVVVRDGKGNEIASAGADHRNRLPDESAHILRALVADQDGRPRYARDVQKFAAVIVNHTIGPRDAGVVRYRAELPAELSLPLSIDVEVVHRSRNPLVSELACAETRSPRGRAFDDFERKAGRSPPDACVAPPETVLARTTLALPQKGPRNGDGDTERLYELGMALSHAVSERMDEARNALEAALAIATTYQSRAQINAMLAVVAGRQSRTEDALAHIARAVELVGPKPAFEEIRGDALARVWRWKEAEAAYTAASTGAPRNASGWQKVAIARGSLGEHLGALAAARTGLALDPRDADMLRVQALSLKALGAEPSLVEAALNAYDLHRPPDDAGEIRIRCATSIPACALERDPVHTHSLR